MWKRAFDNIPMDQQGNQEKQSTDKSTDTSNTTIHN